MLHRLRSRSLRLGLPVFIRPFPSQLLHVSAARAEWRDENRESVSAEEALARLYSGNLSYRRATSDAEWLKLLQDGTNPERLQHLASAGQRPIAAVVGCADSRVSPSLAFGCGQGSLFVVRNAGNVCGVDTIASCDYAVSQLEVPLLIVLGHTGCGAVEAAIEAKRSADAAVARGEGADSVASPSWHVQSVLDRIKPSVEFADEFHADLSESDATVMQNALVTAKSLIAHSAIIREAVQKPRGSPGSLQIVVVVYDTKTGGLVEVRPNEAALAHARHAAVVSVKRSASQPAGPEPADDIGFMPEVSVSAVQAAGGVCLAGGHLRRTAGSAKGYDR